MEIIQTDYTTRSNIQANYNKYTTSGAQPGYNGITGFKKWECYMLVKYGHANSFGLIYPAALETYPRIYFNSLVLPIACKK